MVTKYLLNQRSEVEMYGNPIVFNQTRYGYKSAILDMILTLSYWFLLKDKEKLEYKGVNYNFTE